MAHTGIKAARISDWMIEDVRIANNGWVGWDGDVYGDDSNSGIIHFKGVTIEYNGCSETYPGEETVACWSQSAGGYGDGLGTGSTGGTWIFEETKFLHNTSDGLDLLYHNGNGEVIVDRVHAEGNAGNQVKVSGDAQIMNSIIVSNCGYFSGKSFGSNVDNCRAGGSAVSLHLNADSQSSIVNSTVYSEGDCLMLAGMDSCNSSQKLTSLNNIFYAGTDFHQQWENSCFLYSDCGGLNFESDYNIIYNVKSYHWAGLGAPCPIGSNDICEDPIIVGFEGDSFNSMISDGSPAKDTGLGIGGMVPDYDFFGVARPQNGGVDRGAIELK